MQGIKEGSNLPEIIVISAVSTMGHTEGSVWPFVALQGFVQVPVRLHVICMHFV